MKYVPELGGRVPVRDERLRTTVEDIYVAGDVAGIEEATAAMLEGELAGLDIALTLNCGSRAEERLEEVELSLKSLRAGPTGEKIRNGISKLNKR